MLATCSAIALRAWPPAETSTIITMRYFIYCRKSTDTEDKQVLSLESQRSELERLAASRWTDATVLEVIEESRSAKTTGRPLFNQIIKRIERGEADGIIAWHPDRLARNAVDGGYMIHLLDRGLLKDLRFATGSFENTSQGKLHLSIMFTFSKYYVDALSENVARGMRTKAEKGWWPGRAPIGYLNDKATTTILVDPERFDLVQRMWKLMLTGSYSPSQILRIATEEWGLRTRSSRRRPSGLLSLSALYKMFGNSFFAGSYSWKGKVTAGNHEAMISLSDFEAVQRLLGREHKSRHIKHTFPLTGVMRCGECGFAITAEGKTNKYGSHYTYYRCTKKRRGYRCSQPQTRLDHLHTQMLGFLERIQVSEDLIRWAIDAFPEHKESELQQAALHLDSLHLKLSTTRKERDTITTLRVKDYIDDAEFLKRREAIDREILRLSDEIEKVAAARDWLAPLDKLISFGNRAADWFAIGDPTISRLIVQTVGSNPTIKNRILSIQAAKPFRTWAAAPPLPDLCSLVKDVRTFIGTNDQNLHQVLTNIDRITELVEEKQLKKAA